MPSCPVHPALPFSPTHLALPPAPPTQPCPYEPFPAPPLHSTPLKPHPPCFHPPCPAAPALTAQAKPRLGTGLSAASGPCGSPQKAPDDPWQCPGASDSPLHQLATRISRRSSTPPGHTRSSARSSGSSAAPATGVCKALTVPTQASSVVCPWASPGCPYHSPCALSAGPGYVCWARGSSSASTRMCGSRRAATCR